MISEMDSKGGGASNVELFNKLTEVIRALNAMEEANTSTNKPSTTCLLCGHMDVCYFYKHSGGGCSGMFVPRTSHVG